jgi:hypothetical protein
MATAPALTWGLETSAKDKGSKRSGLQRLKDETCHSVGGYGDRGYDGAGAAD